MVRLDKKSALITGASRGIGRATALALANEGAYVLIHFGKSSEAANTLAEEIRQRGGHAHTVGADLAGANGAAELAARNRELVSERLDIFVANAGISKAASIEDHTIEDFDGLFATNVCAPFFLLQQLLPLLDDGSSVIVTTSLVARFSPGESGQRARPPYRLKPPQRVLWKHS